jgi:acetaldehyde dehydrogenase (acetylating)
MAEADRDLTSIAEARATARAAKAAWLELAELSQERIDRIVDAMAVAATQQAEAFARQAVEETGYGVMADKVQKNLFASQRVYDFIRPMKTVGVVARHEARRTVEVAEPFGVVAAIVPSTNPTSTAIYKILIAVKARCSIVLSPHPSAVRCITRVAEVLSEAAERAGAPRGTISWMTTVTIEGTQELMKHRDVAVILATGGMGLVRAAYSAGKPAYGVGPGNAPAYIERTANVKKAVSDVIAGKTFDNGVLCSSENSVVVDAAIADTVREEFLSQGGVFLSRSHADALTRELVTPQRLPNPALVGKSASVIAEKCGIATPPGTRVLIVELDGVGRDFPLSMEKLCPVLSMYVVQDWREGCERCKEILRYGGMGHTMSIHSQDEQVILEFGLKKPAFRIVVNSPTTHGSIGLTTGLDPAMTLGCGGYGGNITSDNIGPRHLLNIKRLAYETVPVAQLKQVAAAPISPRPPAGRISADILTKKIDQFLATRGFVTEDVERRDRGDRRERELGLSAGPRDARPEGRAYVQGAAPSDASGGTRPGSSDTSNVGPTFRSGIEGFPQSPTPNQPPTPTLQPPLDFVCEEDVRLAIQAGRQLAVSERAIITPAARDLAERHHVFAQPR